MVCYALSRAWAHPGHLSNGDMPGGIMQRMTKNKSGNFQEALGWGWCYIHYHAVVRILHGLWYFWQLRSRATALGKAPAVVKLLGIVRNVRGVRVSLEEGCGLESSDHLMHCFCTIRIGLQYAVVGLREWILGWPGCSPVHIWTVNCHLVMNHRVKRTHQQPLHGRIRLVDLLCTGRFLDTAVVLGFRFEQAM